MKRTVEDKKEAMFLINEAIRKGRANEIDDTAWHNHEGTYIFTTQMESRDVKDAINIIDIKNSFKMYVESKRSK